jgi:N-acetylneuraminate synthase/N,N'-diacetyllegionaminate synthase
MGLAGDLVDLAADAGADAFKTQVFDVDRLIARRADDWRERLRPRNLTLEQCEELQERCLSRGLLFLTTAHDESRIPWLVHLDVPAVKVGSGERNNPAFIRALASLGKPMILSTGMYGEHDVRQALEACAQGGCRDVALLHCVTAYPSPDEALNLRAMDVLSQIAPVPVGWSDHTADSLAVYAAVARGARVIEKHITILRNVPNAQDWKVASGGFRRHRHGDSPKCSGVRQKGDSLRRPDVGDEVASRRGAVAIASRVLTYGPQRPGDGIPPDVSEIEGRVLRVAAEDLG